MRQTYISEIRIACLIVAAMFSLVGISGCSSTRMAQKNFDKANRQSHETVLYKCSEMSPPLTRTKDSFIYKQGETIVTAGDTVTNTDTFNNTITKYITKYLKSVDTVYRSKENTEVDRSLEKAQAITIGKQGETIASDKTKLRLCYWIIGVLGIYTIGRLIWKYGVKKGL